MNYLIISLLGTCLVISACHSKRGDSRDEIPVNAHSVSVDQPVLRHVVLFKFNDSARPEDVEMIENAFRELPARIDAILDFEWGINNSPEGLHDGFTHCFFLTFSDEAAREVYLPHPDHAAFGELLRPYLDKVLVVDYWTEN
jgi:hypothetical protein